MHLSDGLKIGETFMEDEAKFKILAHLLPVGVYSTDKNGIITFYNEKAAQLWGRHPKLNDPNEIKFSGSWKLYKEDNTPLPHSECLMAKCLRNKKGIRDKEVCIERKDGTKLNVVVTIDPLFDSHGELVGALNVFQDISGIKLGQEYKNRLAAIVESSDDAIISKTLEGKIMTWNKGAEKILGYTSEEAVGKSINILIPPTHINDVTIIIDKIKKGEKIEHFETIRVAKDGRNINASITVSPVKNDKGKIIGASKILRDISERIKTENQLKEYAQKLQELNQYKDEFMAMASHELKTPLTVIKANLQILELSLLNEKDKSFVDKTLKQVYKMSGLICDLLDITKIQSGNLEMTFADFDLNDLVNEVVENIQQTCSTHKIVKENFEGNHIVHGDRIRLEHVLVNVLNNAIKYSPSANKIVVSIIDEGDKIIISMKDFGIGIPAEDLEMVFSRFFRVRGLSATFSGTGIGLYISNNIVTRHGGKMWAESVLNEGSTFYFYLPVKKDHPK